MNDKEKKAIEKIEKKILIGECEKSIGVPIYISDLKIVLNLIENQKAEIEQLKIAGNGIELLLKQKVAEIEKKDKQIDLMAEEILYENNCSGELDFEIYKDKEEVIKDFENKAEEDK